MPDAFRATPRPHQQPLGQRTDIARRSLRASEGSSLLPAAAPRSQGCDSATAPAVTLLPVVTVAAREAPKISRGKCIGSGDLVDLGTHRPCRWGTRTRRSPTRTITAAVITAVSWCKVTRSSTHPSTQFLGLGLSTQRRSAGTSARGTLLAAFAAHAPRWS